MTVIMVGLSRPLAIFIFKLQKCYVSKVFEIMVVFSFIFFIHNSFISILAIIHILTINLSFFLLAYNIIFTVFYIIFAIVFFFSKIESFLRAVWISIRKFDFAARSKIMEQTFSLMF